MRKDAMKVLVIGASGKLGTAITSEAVNRGLEVTALVRSKSKAQNLPSPVPVLEGDGRDAKVLAKALAGQDAIVIPAGGRTEPVTGAIVEALLPLLKANGNPRLIVISAYGAVEPTGFYGWMMKTMAAGVAKDKTSAEAAAKKSGTEWTAVRPGVLTDEGKSGKVRAHVGQRLKGMPRISRADVAGFVVDELVAPKFKNAAPVVYVDGTQR